MIDPTGGFKVVWDVLMLLQLLYICVEAPFTICFAVEYPLGSALGAIDMAINACFALDILLNLRMGRLCEWQCSRRCACGVGVSA